MANTVLNLGNPFPTQEWVFSKNLPDVTTVSGAQTTVNTGITGLTAMRATFNFKTFGTLTAADTVDITIQVGTGAALTNPRQLLYTRRVVLTGDTAIDVQLIGLTQVAFQSYAVTVATASSHTVTYDYTVECA